MSQNTEIEKFVNRVRAKLADLDAATIAELTDGLEADLQDRAGEEGAGFKLGNPAAYAEELRASAGLGSSSPARSVIQRVAKWIWVTAVQFVKTLAPAWWVLRGAIAGELLSWWVTGSLSIANWSRLGFLVVAGCTVLSVLIGMKLPRNLYTRLIASVANIALVVGGAYLGAAFYQRVVEYYDLRALNGVNILTWHGKYLGRLDAYDAKGKRLPLSVLKSQYGWIVYDASQYSDSSAKSLAPSYTDVIGMSMAEALDYLSNNGFKGAEFQYVSGQQPRGTVIGVQEEITVRGRLILVIVSNGN